MRRRDGEYLVVSYPLYRPASFAKLSKAEVDVVEGVLEGLTLAAIAKRQGVTRRTAENQLATAYVKLGVDTAAELAGLCSRSKEAN